MKDTFGFAIVALLGALVITVAGLSVLANAPGPAPASSAPAAPSSVPTPATVYRNLTIAFDPASGDFQYSNLDLNVPHGLRVVFSITNFYFHAARLPNASDALVTGTLGGSMDLTTPLGPVATEGVVPENVSHTFTVWNGFYHLNVPVPTASASGVPSKVTFAVVFTTRGTFTFGCVVLCGGSGMSAPDAMFGSLNVD